MASPDYLSFFFTRSPDGRYRVGESPGELSGRLGEEITYSHLSLLSALTSGCRTGGILAGDHLQISPWVSWVGDGEGADGTSDAGASNGFLGEHASKEFGRFGGGDVGGEDTGPGDVSNGGVANGDAGGVNYCDRAGPCAGGGFGGHDDGGVDGFFSGGVGGFAGEGEKDVGRHGGFGGKSGGESGDVFVEGIGVGGESGSVRLIGGVEGGNVGGELGGAGICGFEPTEIGDEWAGEIEFEVSKGSDDEVGKGGAVGAEGCGGGGGEGGELGNASAFGLGSERGGGFGEGIAVGRGGGDEFCEVCLNGGDKGGFGFGERGGVRGKLGQGGARLGIQRFNGDGDGRGLRVDGREISREDGLRYGGREEGAGFEMFKNWLH
jgi:hypothetical protein